MPQLNPSPWLMIFLFTWSVFLAFMIPKVLAHTLPYKLSTQSVIKPNTKPWNWPW